MIFVWTFLATFAIGFWYNIRVAITKQKIDKLIKGKQKKRNGFLKTNLLFSECFLDFFKLIFSFGQHDKVISFWDCYYDTTLITQSKNKWLQIEYNNLVRYTAFTLKAFIVCFFFLLAIQVFS